MASSLSIPLERSYFSFISHRKWSLVWRVRTSRFVNYITRIGAAQFRLKWKSLISSKFTSSLCLSRLQSSCTRNRFSPDRPCSPPRLASTGTFNEKWCPIAIRGRVRTVKKPCCILTRCVFCLFLNPSAPPLARKAVFIAMRQQCFARTDILRPTYLFLQQVLSAHKLTLMNFD